MTFLWLTASIMSISSNGLLFPCLPVHLHLPRLHFQVGLCQHHGHEQPLALASTTQRLSTISSSSLTLWLSSSSAHQRVSRIFCKYKPCKTACRPLSPLKGRRKDEVLLTLPYQPQSTPRASNLFGCTDTAGLRTR